MKTLVQQLFESYVNLVGDNTKKEKSNYSEQVYNMIQNAYASQGGMHGSGFRSPEDMVENIPFWKLVKKGGKIVAGAMYKDKGGRKRVAIFTDGTEGGRKELDKINLDEIRTNRAFQELSGRSLSVMRKIAGFYDRLIPVDNVKQVLKSDKIYTDIPKDDPDEMWDRFPEMRQYMYQREIGGHLHTKVMIGNIEQA